MTQESEAEIRITALTIGAAGYLLKANAETELLPATEAALQDGHDARALACD
jgi:hypothetical protein